MALKIGIQPQGINNKTASVIIDGIDSAMYKSADEFISAIKPARHGLKRILQSHLNVNNGKYENSGYASGVLKNTIDVVYNGSAWKGSLGAGEDGGYRLSPATYSQSYLQGYFAIETAFTLDMLDYGWAIGDPNGMTFMPSAYNITKWVLRKGIDRFYEPK